MNQVDPDIRSEGPAPTLRELLPRHLPHLETYVRSHLGRTLRDRESASDLVISVCGDLLEEGIQFEYHSEPQFLSWLHTVVGNKIRQRLRYFGAQKRGAEKRTQVQASDSQFSCAKVDHGTPSQEAIVREDLGLLDQSMALLPDQYRELIVRIHLRREPHARVAEELGRSVASTRNMLTRALVKLAGVMDRVQQGR